MRVPGKNLPIDTDHATRSLGEAKVLHLKDRTLRSSGGKQKRCAGVARKPDRPHEPTASVDIKGGSIMELVGGSNR
jgi:hypothetical protein